MNLPKNNQKQPLFIALGLSLALVLTAALIYFFSLPAELVVTLLILMSVVCLFLAKTLLKGMKSFTTLEAHYMQTCRDVDELTGLPDQKEFIARLDIECRRSVREFSPLSLMYIGIDRPTDDAAILKVSESLFQAIYRPADMLARLDEKTFGLILPCTNEQVKQLADRCLASLAELNIDSQARVGLCTYQPTNELDAEYAMDKARALLESAQSSGETIVSTSEDYIDPSITYQ